ncbi:MAG: SusD/RagB family nutrient-binding outer membrane lipoprotein, partial [Gemmatimonadaceae bacterium]
MRKTRVALLVGSLSLVGGCENFLDVNTNPNAPTEVAANLYLPPMLHWMVSGQQWDGRFIGHYTQQWISTSSSFSPARTWGLMGYDPSSDNGGQQWRDVYWSFGQNLIDMINKAEAEQRWDVLGVGYILKAWGWQALTDLHGEIIVKEAIDQTKFSFNYDDQQFVYEEVRRLLEQAITNLQRTDGAVDQNFLARGDRIYNGDRQKWLKFAYGLRAINLNHYSNKSTYRPAEV